MAPNLYSLLLPQGLSLPPANICHQRPGSLSMAFKEGEDSYENIFKDYFSLRSFLVAVWEVAHLVKGLL